MASGVGFYAQGYFAANYWDAEFWAPTGTPESDYWGDFYWNANYWNVNYWLEITLSTGDVEQENLPGLPLLPIDSFIRSGPDILASTPVLDLTSFATDANLDIDPAITTPNLPFIGLNVAVGTEGYVLGDISLTFSPESTFTITYGVVANAPALPLGPQNPTVEAEGFAIAVGNTATLPLMPWPVNAANTVVAEPVTAVLPLVGLDAAEAGVGVIIGASLPSLAFTTPTHGIDADPASLIIPSQVVVLPLVAHDPVVRGSNHLFVPPSTFGDYGALIVNDNADPFPSNYEICERTGFRVRPGELVKEWNNTMVRQRSYERRHPQDFVRSISDKQRGSKRPEQTDRFVGEDVPRVEAADL